MKKAIVLLSGGLDSTTCLAIAKAQGIRCYALSFDYGQRHQSELLAAKKIAESMAIEAHRTVTLDISQFGGSALTDTAIDVPNYKKSDTIPITYVPARNTIFLAIALGYAETVGATEIFIGANHVDYSNYPDCRPAFIRAFETLANLGTKSGVEGDGIRIRAPLLELSKAEIIQRGLALGVQYSETASCYQLDTKGRACGTCDSCALRKQGFLDANTPDPTRYQNI